MNKIYDVGARMNTKVIAIILVIGAIFLTAACRPGGLLAAKPYKETRFLMDTIIEMTAYGPNAEAAVKAAFGEFKRLHDISNNFDPNSQVSQVNRMAGKAKVQVDPELVQMIKHANEMSDRLEGVFDVTIGPLTDLWGVGHKGQFVPSQAEIDKVLPLVNYRLVQLDTVANTVYLPKAGMMLDLGAIAKETAVRKACDILKAHGVESALINAGGDVRVIGRRPDGNPWRIGVQHPRNPDAIVAKLALTVWDTMETSGDYQRYIEKDGVRYSHILDPRTGRQPRQLASVTLISSSASKEDIFTTALFVLGPEKSLEIVRQHPGFEVIMVTPEGKVITSPGLAGKVEIGK